MDLENEDSITILIVEKEKIIAMNIAGSLKSLGYEVSGNVVCG